MEKVIEEQHQLLIRKGWYTLRELTNMKLISKSIYNKLSPINLIPFAHYPELDIEDILDGDTLYLEYHCVNEASDDIEGDTSRNNILFDTSNVIWCKYTRLRQLRGYRNVVVITVEGDAMVSYIFTALVDEDEYSWEYYGYVLEELSYLELNSEYPSVRGNVNDILSFLSDVESKMQMYKNIQDDFLSVCGKTYPKFIRDPITVNNKVYTIDIPRGYKSEFDVDLTPYHNILFLCDVGIHHMYSALLMNKKVTVFNLGTRDDFERMDSDMFKKLYYFATYYGLKLKINDNNISEYAWSDKHIEKEDLFQHYDLVICEMRHIEYIYGTVDAFHPDIYLNDSASLEMTQRQKGDNHPISYYISDSDICKWHDNIPIEKELTMYRKRIDTISTREEAANYVYSLRGYTFTETMLQLSYIILYYSISKEAAERFVMEEGANIRSLSGDRWVKDTKWYSEEFKSFLVSKYR